jgi:hypothetical protein
MSDLDEARSQVINALANWAHEWYAKETGAAVEAHPAAVERLATDGQLAEVKAKVQNLEGTAYQAIEVHAGADDLWPHLSPQATWDLPPGMTADRLPKALDEPFRLVLGELAKLLGSYGLVELDTRSNRWEVTSDGVRYSNALTLPQAVQEAVSNYTQQWHDEQESRQRAEQAGRDAEAAKARGLWEQA